MIRLTRDIVSYATWNKIEDRGAFLKKTFKPDFDISTLNKLDVLKINEGLQEKKVNRNLYLQLDNYLNSKDKKVSKATICVYNYMGKSIYRHMKNLGRKKYLLKVLTTNFTTAL